VTAPARRVPSSDSSTRTAPQADDACLGGALLPGVPGILVISGEYAAGGTTRATLAAEPRQPLVLAAKVPVSTAVSLATQVLSVLFNRSAQHAQDGRVRESQGHEH
jgi:hypothetical protein